MIMAQPAIQSVQTGMKPEDQIFSCWSAGVIWGYAGEIFPNPSPLPIGLCVWEQFKDIFSVVDTELLLFLIWCHPHIPITSSMIFYLVIFYHIKTLGYENEIILAILQGSAAQQSVVLLIVEFIPRWAQNVFLVLFWFLPYFSEICKVLIIFKTYVVFTTRHECLLPSRKLFFISASHCMIILSFYYVCPVGFVNSHYL